MERKIQNIISIILFLVLSIFITRQACNYIQGEARQKEKIIEICSWLDESNDTMVNFCKENEELNYKHGDFYYMFYNVFCENTNVIYMISLIVFSSSVYASVYYKNKKNLKKIEKKNNKALQKEMLLNTYKPVLAFVASAVYAMILCYIYNKGFSYNFAVYSLGWSLNVIKHAYIFVPLFLLNLTIHGLLYANITYLFIRKFPSVVVSSILSIACLFVIEVVYEFVIEGILFNYVLNLSISSYFTVFNFLSFMFSYSSLLDLIVPLATLIFSYILIYIVYKDKQKLVKDLKTEQKNPLLGLNFTL